VKKFTLLFYLLFFCFVRCNRGNNKPSLQSNKFFIIGRFLVKETYDSTGKIKTKQYFNNDTIPDGAYIEYFDNGIIAKWRWYTAKHKNPYCGVFYSEQSTFDTFKGQPFLGIENNINNKPLIKLINPPQITVNLLYKDFYHGKVVNEIMYDPLLTDTVSWIPLDEYDHRQDHKYKIYFYIVDTVKASLLYQDSLEIKER